MTPISPLPEIKVDPAAVLSNEDLQRLGGYRTGPAPFFGRYGYGPIPNIFEASPGESVEDAGDRLAL